MTDAGSGPRWALPFLLALGALATVLLSSAASAGPAAQTDASAHAGEVRILFIGNSLTASNDLPDLVEGLAAAAGFPLRCEARTEPNFSLEDHWSERTQTLIREGGFKFVVLQQGPSSLPSSRSNLRLWTRRFNEAVRAAGAIPALYMVWPDRSRMTFFPQVSESYRLAAEDVQGRLLPVGEVFQAAWRVNPKLDLLSADNFHPSRLGTYAAAVTILSALTRVSPQTLPARVTLGRGADYKLDEAKARLVLSVVDQVLSGKSP